VVLWSHTECFPEFTDPAVDPDPPAEHGRIPARARCILCGDKLPRVGAHPYSIDVGEASPPNRYWGHAQCVQERFGQTPVTSLQADTRNPKE
jgi:hypothetical protein